MGKREVYPSMLLLLKPWSMPISFTSRLPVLLDMKWW